MKVVRFNQEHDLNNLDIDYVNDFVNQNSDFVINQQQKQQQHTKSAQIQPPDLLMNNQADRDVFLKITNSGTMPAPMPGAIVSVSVEPGQIVSEGQELFVIEAMKMQNIIKSQVEGKIKRVNVKAGVSVSVDQLLIEFE